MKKKELLYTVILVVASSLASILIWGFHFGIKNNEFHLIIVNKIAQGVSYQGDALASAMNNYVSPFWVVVGLLAKVFPAKIVFFAFFFISRVLLCIGLASIIHAFSKNRSSLHAYVLSALATMSSGMVNVLPLGANSVTSDYLSQTFLSVGFCLLSLSLSVRKKNVWSAIILGIAYNINAMQSNFVLGILLVMWLVNARNDKNAFVTVGLPIGLFLLCASPTLYWIVSALHGGPVGTYMKGFAIADFSKYYFPGHFFWTLKSFRDKINGISIITTPLTLALSGFVIKDTVFNCFRKKEVLSASLVTLSYLIIGALSVEMFPARLFFQLHFFRSDIIIYLIALSFLLSLLMAKDLPPFTWLMIVAGIAEYVTNAFFKAQLFVLWAIVIEGARCYKAKDSFTKVINLFFVVILCVLFIRTGYREILLLMPFFLYYLIRLMHRQSSAVESPVPFPKDQTMAVKNNRLLEFSHQYLLAVGYLCALVFVIYSSYIVRTDYYSEKETEQQEIRALADKVSYKVPANALFLIPPWYEIRPYLEHGVFLSMKDGAAYLWEKGYEFEYIRRLNVLGIPYTPGVQFNDSEIRQYFFNSINNTLTSVKHEGVTHVILPKTLFSLSSNIIESQIIGVSENFVVLDLDSALNFVKKNSTLTLISNRYKTKAGS
jgi:hypothetical protein